MLSKSFYTGPELFGKILKDVLVMELLTKFVLIVLQIALNYLYFWIKENIISNIPKLFCSVIQSQPFNEFLRCETSAPLQNELHMFIVS